MILTDIEYKTFLKANLSLLFYVGKQGNIIPENMNFKEFKNLDFSIKFKCRNFFLKNKKLLDDYLSKSSEQLTTEEITILTGFKKSISSSFIIFKYLSKNAIFINTNDNQFYAVKALGDPFSNFFDRFPVLVEATILPFNNQIIYDGFIESKNLYFGSNMKLTMAEHYKQAKKNKQILTTI